MSVSDTETIAGRNLDSRNLDSRNLDSRNVASPHVAGRQIAGRQIAGGQVDSRQVAGGQVEGRNVELGVHPAWQLLSEYTAGADALFASPTRTVLASGNLLDRCDGSMPAGGLDLEIDRLLASHDVPLVLAAVPYDPDGVARVVVPESLQVCGPLDKHPLEDAMPGHALSRNGHGGSWRITTRPTRAGYAHSVAGAVERIAAGQLAKVVLARALDLSGGSVDANAILGRLARHDPHGYTYALELPPTATGGTRRLIGASPELLVARTGRRVVARPVGGSAARASDPIEDVRRGAALLASAKDLAEHAFVVDAVVQSLSPYCRDVVAPIQPTLVRTATMWHLLTEVTGDLLDTETSSLTLALALHPTPAVCGTPTAAAHAAIGELEGFDRGFYAGVVGWCDAAGDGEWAVALRCAELRSDTIRLYAGAGIVAGSDPISEVAETGAKFRTMLNAMGTEYDA